MRTTTATPSKWPHIINSWSTGVSGIVLAHPPRGVEVACHQMVCHDQSEALNVDSGISSAWSCSVDCWYLCSSVFCAIASTTSSTFTRPAANLKDSYLHFKLIAFFFIPLQSDDKRKANPSYFRVSLFHPYPGSKQLGFDILLRFRGRRRRRNRVNRCAADAV